MTSSDEDQSNSCSEPWRKVIWTLTDALPPMDPTIVTTTAVQEQHGLADERNMASHFAQ